MATILTGIKIQPRLVGLCVMAGLVLQTSATITATILAGGETDLPADTPSGRLDTDGIFSFVGALAISSGGGNYKGSAVALSREWVSRLLRSEANIGDFITSGTQVTGATATPRMPA